MLITSTAFNAPRVVWVAARARAGGRLGGLPAHREQHHPQRRRRLVFERRQMFRRPTPDWWVGRRRKIYGPDGFEAGLTLSVPGKATIGNAAQAVAAAVAMVFPIPQAVAAVGYRRGGSRTLQHPSGRQPFGTQTLLAKNPPAGRGAVDDRPGRRRSGDRRQKPGSRRRDLSWLSGRAVQAFGR